MDTGKSFGLVRIGVLLAAAGGLGVGLATSEGCGGTSGPTVGSNSELMCGDCVQYAYNCTNKEPVCAPDDVTAGVQLNCQYWTEKKDCTNNYPGTGGDGGGSDDGAGQGSSCDTWDPDSLVEYNRSTQKYEVDQKLIDDLEAKPSLLDCDSARSKLLSGGYYELYNVGRDDLSSHLGLRSDDVIKAVNGHDLLTSDDYLDAYSALKGETDFELEIDRGGLTITIRYEIQ